jgi:hypothetical protein
MKSRPVPVEGHRNYDSSLSSSTIRTALRGVSYDTDRFNWRHRDQVRNGAADSGILLPTLGQNLVDCRGCPEGRLVGAASQMILCKHYSHPWVSDPKFDPTAAPKAFEKTTPREDQTSLLEPSQALRNASGTASPKSNLRRSQFLHKA